MSKRTWEGLATIDPVKVTIITSTTRECSKCKKVFQLTEEQAAKDPLIRTIYYCSTECSLD